MKGGTKRGERKDRKRKASEHEMEVKDREKKTRYRKENGKSDEKDVKSNVVRKKHKK